MARVLAAIVGLGLFAQLTRADVVVDDDFSTFNTSVWNTGGGYFYGSVDQSLALNTFGGWGAIGDGQGAAGLNSTVGYASFAVAPNGEEPIDGNFNIGSTTFENTAFALVHVDLALGGAGNYQVMWNNSSETQPFEIPGWAGTLGPHSNVWIVDGPATPNWGVPAVATGTAATTFGFWESRASSTAYAIIDDVVIWDTLSIASTGLDGDYNGDDKVDAADYILWRKNPGAFGGDPDGYNTWSANFGTMLGAGLVSGSSTVFGVPEPASISLATIVAIAGVIAVAKRRTRILGQL